MRRREALSIPPCPEYTRQIRQLRQPRALFFRLRALTTRQPVQHKVVCKGNVFSPAVGGPGVPRTSFERITLLLSGTYSTPFGWARKCP